MLQFTNMNDSLAHLNESQQMAVAQTNGPLLIVAGAGTGKTTTLVEKISHLLKSSICKPEEILCLTFTEKASSEMTERVDMALPYGYSQLAIHTFHGFADAVLRNTMADIGMSTGYKLMTQAESILYIKKHIFDLKLAYYRPASNPTKFIEALLIHFSRLQDEDISPEYYLEWVHAQKKDTSESIEEREKLEELATAYSIYQQLKIRDELCDFSDLISYHLQLYRKRAHILAAHQKQYKYVMVDEFQDTNIAQYQLIKLLCPPSQNPNLTVVGDDSQAIYKFRGASISNIMSFMSDYPRAQQISLRDNYRSNQTILDRAHTLIQNNNPDTLEFKLGISKKLLAHTPKRIHSVSFHHFSHGLQEATYVANTILDLKAKEGYRFSDFCILVRANMHSEIFTAEMRSQGIPYQFHGPGTLFKQSEIKDLVAYLKLLTDIENSTAMYRVLAMDIFGIDQQDVLLLISFAKKISRSLYQAGEICCAFFHPEWKQEEMEIYRPYLPLIHKDSRTKLTQIVGMIKKHLRQIRHESAAHILYQFLEETGYFKYLLAGTKGDEQDTIQNISQLLRRLRQLETQHDLASVFDAVSYFEMSIDLGESPLAVDSNRSEKRNAVHIMTIHGAKGLEFPVVFLPHLIAGRFPSTSRSEQIPLPDALIKELLPQGDFHLQEERRLFYVGLTRAKDFVVLTASDLYDDGVRKRKISPFVGETIGREALEKTMQKKIEEKQQLSLFDIQFPVRQTDQTIHTPVKIKNLSYSQLQSYEMCPLQYKYQYIFKIPTPPAGAASFGSSIHIVLQKFYEACMNNPQLGKDEMLAMLERYWIPLGYASQAHEKKMKEEARAMLARYFDTFHNPHARVISLEKLFRVKIDDSISVTGKIDRVDATEEGGIEIVDYKTGKTPDEKELKKSLQLSIYAKAATDPGILNTSVTNVKLTLYYLQDMKKFTSTRTAEDLIEVGSKIKLLAAEIQKGNFAPKPGPWCNFCPFRLICEAW